MNKAIIFDLDGTLVNTLDSLHITVNKTLERLGYPNLPKNKCKAFIGNGVKVLVEKSLMYIAGELPKETQNKAHAIFKEEFDKYCTYNVKPYDGITKMLETLKSKGYKLAVLTNKPHEQGIIAVEKMFGSEIFTLIQGQVDGKPRKPDPNSLLDVIERLNVAKSDCTYIGDSEVDMQTGTLAKVFTIGVTWGFRDKELLIKEKANKIAETPKEVLEIINAK